MRYPFSGSEQTIAHIPASTSLITLLRRFAAPSAQGLPPSLLWQTIAQSMQWWWGRLHTHLWCGQYVHAFHLNLFQFPFDWLLCSYKMTKMSSEHNGWPQYSIFMISQIIPNIYIQNLFFEITLLANILLRKMIDNSWLSVNFSH